MPSYRAKYTDAERKAFGELLRRLMQDKGFSGADLARRANKHLTSGKGMDRSAVSWYLNGRSIPTPASLGAIAKVLEVDPHLLLPRGHGQKPNESAGPVAGASQDVRMSLMPADQMHLMVNVSVSRETGWKILKLLEAEPQ